MAFGDSERLQQILCRAEDDYANLAAAANGTPNAAGFHTPGSDPASGLTCANPAFSASYEVAENEEVRNRPYRNAPVLLSRNAEVTADLYIRGNGADDSLIFTDRVFTALDAFFGVRSSHPIEHDIQAFNAINSIGIDDAYENGLRAGMGFHIVLPTGKSFVAFVISITDVGTPGEDTVTFDPPLTAAELTACQAEAAGSVKLRGGLTYAVGDEYADATSLYFLLLKQGYAQEVFGARGATLAADLQVKQAGVFNCTWQGAFTHQGGYAPTTAATAWTATDTLTVADASALRAGMYAYVTTTEAPAGTYVVRIREIDGTTVYLEPTDLPAGITAEAPVPALTRITPGSTAVPNGKWLVFLNGRVWADGEYRHIRSANWQINTAPVMIPTANNMAGAVDAVMGEPEITCEIVYSAYDDGAQFQNFLDSAEFSVICVLGDGTPGNAVALYCPKMHNAEAPAPGEADTTTTLQTTLRAGLHSGDDDAYDGTNPSNTVCRLFFAW